MRSTSTIYEHNRVRFISVIEYKLTNSSLSEGILITDNNLIVDLLKAIPILIRESINLIGEGEANRKNFFELNVQPIHKSCETLFDAHLITLQLVLEALQDDNEELANEIVEKATLFEQGNTDSLAVAITYAKTIEVRGELGDLYSFYLLCVGKILITPPERGGSYKPDIALYDGLIDLRTLGLLNPARVKELVEYLFKWNRRLLTAYTELQNHCLSK